MGGLAETLCIMINRAQQQPGEPVRVRLAHKLTISMMVNKSSPKVVHLQLARMEVMPGMQEWKTVVGLMPSCVVLSGPLALSTDKFYLKGQVRLSDGLRLPP